MGAIIGGLIGNEASGDDRRAARNSMSEAVGAFRDLKVPTKEEMEIALQDLKLQGVLSPEMEEAIRQDPSLLSQFSADPQLRAAQMGALENLRQLGQTGLDATDRAAYNQLRLEAARDAKAQQDSILQNMQARGMAGSGQELAAKLMSAQNQAQIQSAQGDKLAADAAQRRLQAIAQSGQLGSQLEQQQFGEAAAKASAQDAINRFNTANQQQIMSANTQARNQAAAQNLANKQRIADTNTGLHNQQEMYNKALPGQIYNMQYNRAAGLAGQLGQQRNMQLDEAQRVSNMWSGIGQGVQEGFGAYGQQQGYNDVYGGKKSSGGDQLGSIGTMATMASIFSDENKKENIKDFKEIDIKELLDKLKGHKYNYKDDPKKEEQVGVMAQDMEKSKLGKKFVENTPEGKVINYGKAMNATYATLANLHERLKKLEEK